MIEGVRLESCFRALPVRGVRNMVSVIRVSGTRLFLYWELQRDQPHLGDPARDSNGLAGPGVVIRIYDVGHEGSLPYCDLLMPYELGGAYVEAPGGRPYAIEAGFAAASGFEPVCAVKVGPTPPEGLERTDGTSLRLPPGLWP